MSPATIAEHPRVKQRAAELFADDSQRSHRETDRAIAGLLMVQWIAGVAIALWLSPRTWIGQTSQVHLHVWAALLLGGFITLPAAALGLARSGHTLTRHVMAVAQMLDSALLIHLTGGRIETHFHVFGSLAFLAFYRDWRVLLSATMVVAADHFGRGVYWPQSVFGVVASTNWRWLEHAWWVVFEDFFLILGIRRALKLLHEVAQRRAELEFNKDLVEQAVHERTGELEAANRELQERIAEEKRIKRELEMARDAADAASRAKSQFLANMSHEVRTPINGIMGMNSLMLQTPLSAEQREYASTLRQCSHALLDLVNDVLDFSQLETGRTGLCEHPLLLEEWLAETIDLYRTEAETKGLRLEWSCNGEVPVRIVADGGRLCQILLNLVGNAVKFTDRGEVIVTVSSRRIDPPADAVVTEPWHELKFAVRDTGIGIPSDRVSLMFQEFSQVDTSMSRRHGGMGLGLVVTERLAALMGGGIGVESQPDKGSTFTVTVRVREKAVMASLDQTPATENSGPIPEPSPEIPARVLASQWPLRILLVEDNIVNQRVASRLLKRFGYDCDVAVNGFEALEALERRRYDVVLMDVHMPEMDGLEATREILNRHPDGVRPQIVAITAHASTHDRDLCLAAGMDDFLTKPVVPGVLEAKLRDAAARIARRATVATPVA